MSPRWNTKYIVCVTYPFASLSCRCPQCDGFEGLCPDQRVGGRNDASVIAGSRTPEDIVSVTYSRPYETMDPSDIRIARWAASRWECLNMLLSGPRGKRKM